MITKFKKEGFWISVASKTLARIFRYLNLRQRFMIVPYQVSPMGATAVSYASGSYSDFSICLQGPCADPQKVTDWIDSSLNLFPGVKIFYGTNSHFHHASPQVEIIRLAPPEKMGYGFNNQRQCVIACLTAAKRLDIEFSVKVRDDLSPFAPEALRYLSALSKINTSFHRRRIVVSSIHSRVNIPFHLCDFVHFGRTEELLRLWSGTPYQDFEISKEDFRKYYVGKTSVFHGNERRLRGHVELGLSAAKLFLDRTKVASYTEAYAMWQELVVNHLAFCNLDDLGVVFDKYDLTPRLHRSFDKAVNHQLSTDLWLAILEDSCAAGHRMEPKVSEDARY